MRTERLVTFAGVGAIGFAVQVAALWFLKSRFGFHYLPATVVATELAVLLNFFCHISWTWSDRPADKKEAMRRFVRFHVTNGTVSLGASVVLMPLLVEVGQLHYLLANVLTVGVCATANFLAADRLVFMPALALAVAWLAAGSPAEAAELRADTVGAFDRYVRLTEARMDGEIGGKVPLLWVDRLAESERQDAYARLKRGDTVVSRLQTRDAGRPIDCPEGLIHDWIGTTFAPRTTVDQTVSLMQAYDRYQSVYSPNVRRSRTIAQQGDHFTVYLQLFMKKIIGVVLNTENDVRYTRIGDRRVHVRSYSTRIAEVEQPGTRDETEAPVGRDNGFLWRFNNYCSLEGRSEGTYIQCESLSLSRAVPTGLGWLVEPFVTSIPRETLEFTLNRMRAALVNGS